VIIDSIRIIEKVIKQLKFRNNWAIFHYLVHHGLIFVCESNFVASFYFIMKIVIFCIRRIARFYAFGIIWAVYFRIGSNRITFTSIKTSIRSSRTNSFVDKVLKRACMISAVTAKKI
jgi:hypothetical protein